MNENHNRVFGLDALRASAIVLVLLCHTAPFYPNRSARIEASLLFSGYIGVEFFFVLSGFLIGGILIRAFSNNCTPGDLKNFWIRRWFRTLPNYFLFLFINLTLIGVSGALPTDWWRYLFFSQHALTNRTFFSESWSLAVEEWFYLIFPLFYLLFFRLGGARLQPARAALRAGITFLFLSNGFRIVLVCALDPSWDDSVRRTLLYRLDAPVYGVCAAAIAAVFPEFWRKFRAPLSSLGMVIFFFSVWYFFTSSQSSLDSSVFARTIYFSLTSASVLCMLPALSNWEAASGAVARSTVLISLWSYSLYLCQLPIRELLLRYEGTLVDGGTGSATLAGAFVALSLLASATLYTWYEKPTTALRNRFADQSKQV